MVFIQILFQVLVPVCLVIVFQESTLEFYVFFIVPAMLKLKKSQCCYWHYLCLLII